MANNAAYHVHHHTAIHWWHWQHQPHNCQHNLCESKSRKTKNYAFQNIAADLTQQVDKKQGIRDCKNNSYHKVQEPTYIGTPNIMETIAGGFILGIPIPGAIITTIEKTIVAIMPAMVACII